MVLYPSYKLLPLIEFVHNSLNAACGEYPSVFYLGFAPHYHTPLEMGRSCGTDRPGEGAREGNGGLSPTAVDRLRAGRPLAAYKNNCLCACARSARPLRFSRAARFISACPSIGSVPVIRPPSARARLRRSVPRLRQPAGTVRYITEGRRDWAGMNLRWETWAAAEGQILGSGGDGTAVRSARPLRRAGTGVRRRGQNRGRAGVTRPARVTASCVTVSRVTAEGCRPPSDGVPDSQRTVQNSRQPGRISAADDGDSDHDDRRCGGAKGVVCKWQAQTAGLLRGTKCWRCRPLRLAAARVPRCQRPVGRPGSARLGSSAALRTRHLHTSAFARRPPD